MRTLIFSDVHSNLEGLLDVVAHAEASGPVDAVWNLGDIVGYGAEPSAAIGELRRLGVRSVAGNHDHAAAGRVDIDLFNPTAAEAALWTRDIISPQERDWLGALPETLTIGDFTLVHGSLREPLWEYIDNSETAREQFGRQQTPYSIVGHSHENRVTWAGARGRGAWRPRRTRRDRAAPAVPCPR